MVIWRARVVLGIVFVVIAIRAGRLGQGWVVGGKDTAGSDDDRFGGDIPRCRWVVLHSANDRFTLDYLAEDDVFSVQMGSLCDGDEELGTVGVLACIGHGKEERSVMIDWECLVLKLFAVDGLSAGAVSGSEIASLAHEPLDDAVELGTSKGERFARFSYSLFAGAKCAKVFGSLGY